MIHEVLMYRAFWSIKDFSNKHSGPLVLTFVDGRVLARPLQSCTKTPQPTLVITVGEQMSGLKHNRWMKVYKALLELVDKEKACQTHQKP